MYYLQGTLDFFDYRSPGSNGSVTVINMFASCSKIPQKSNIVPEKESRVHWGEVRANNTGTIGISSFSFSNLGPV